MRSTITRIAVRQRKRRFPVQYRAVFGRYRGGLPTVVIGVGPPACLDAINRRVKCAMQTGPMNWKLNRSLLAPQPSLLKR